MCTILGHYLNPEQDYDHCHHEWDHSEGLVLQRPDQDQDEDAAQGQEDGQKEVVEEPGKAE